jgi:hypothetical protein
MPGVSGNEPSDSDSRRLRCGTRNLPTSGNEPSDSDSRRLRCGTRNLPMPGHEGSDAGLGGFRCWTRSLAMSGHNASDSDSRRLRRWTRSLPIATHEGSDTGLGAFRCRATRLPISILKPPGPARERERPASRRFSLAPRRARGGGCPLLALGRHHSGHVRRASEEGQPLPPRTADGSVPGPATEQGEGARRRAREVQVRD